MIINHLDFFKVFLSENPLLFFGIFSFLMFIFVGLIIIAFVGDD